MDRKGELASMERRRAWLYQDQKSFRRKLNHSIDQADGFPMAEGRLVDVLEQQSLSSKTNTAPPRTEGLCDIQRNDQSHRVRSP